MLSKAKLYLITKQKHSNYKRKLAFFTRHSDDLYFEVGCFFMGSHTSYHKDGNIFRTSPATYNKAEKSGTHIPLKDFRGWYQLGYVMINKTTLDRNPIVKQKDFNKNTLIHEIELEKFPSPIINIVIELMEPCEEVLLKSESVAPPPEAELMVIKDFSPWVVLTFLGHEHNLLIKPTKDNIVVSHFNSRYSTNAKGVNYTLEAYA